MTNKTEGRKRREVSELTILRTLVMAAQAVESVGFESKDKPIPHEAVPHSTLLKLLPKLLEAGTIVKVKERRLKKGRPDLKVPSFKITIFGLIRLFVLLDELGIELSLTNARKMMQNSQDLLGWIAVNWVFLITLYNERGMFNLLTSIAKTIKVIEPSDLVFNSSTTDESVWTVIIGSNDDNRDAWPCRSFTDAENIVLRRLSFEFVDGLIRFAVSKQSKYMVEELRMIKNTSRIELLNKLDSNLKLDYRQHIEFRISRHKRKIQDLEETLKILRV